MRVRYDARAIDQLGAFPLRGTPRFELYPGLRTIPHRKRYTIGYLVGDDSVTIVGIRSAGQTLDVLTGD